jgi:hypothetical protein
MHGAAERPDYGRAGTIESIIAQELLIKDLGVTKGYSGQRICHSIEIESADARR